MPHSKSRRSGPPVFGPGGNGGNLPAITETANQGARLASFGIFHPTYPDWVGRSPGRERILTASLIFWPMPSCSRRGDRKRPGRTKAGAGHGRYQEGLPRPANKPLQHPALLRPKASDDKPGSWFPRGASGWSGPRATAARWRPTTLRWERSAG
jgi:hypothetical protein